MYGYSFSIASLSVAGQLLRAVAGQSATALAAAVEEDDEEAAKAALL